MKKFVSELIIIQLLLGLGISGLAQSYSQSQNINRSFAASRNTSVDIVNKYGRVQVLRWNKDSVKIEVEFRINSSALSKIGKVKDWISFEITGNGAFISAKTIFKPGYASVISDIVNVAESIVDPGNQVIINYTVHAPDFVELQINNKFGDIYLDDFNGRTDIVLSNGQLKANRLGGKSSIEINFGGGYATEITDGKLRLAFSDFQLKNAGQLSLSSSSSKTNIDNVHSLHLDSRRDRIRINKATDLFGSSYFSEIWADELSGETNLSLKYGSLNLDRISKNFSLIRLSSEYTDLDVFFDSDASYNFDITYPNDAFVRVPHDIAKFEEKTAEGDPPLKMSYGPVGKNPARSKVTITVMKKANVSVNQR